MVSRLKFFPDVCSHFGERGIQNILDRIFRIPNSSRMDRLVRLALYLTYICIDGMDDHVHLPWRSECGGGCSGGRSSGSGDDRDRRCLAAAQSLQLLLPGQLLLKGFQQMATCVHVICGLPSVLFTVKNKKLQLILEIYLKLLGGIEMF